MKLFSTISFLVLLPFGPFNSLSKELIPTLKTEFYIKNGLDDENNLKWVSIYNYDDNSTLMQINEKELKFNYTSKLLSYRPTRNNIFLEAKDFREIIFNLMDTRLHSFVLNRVDTKIHVHKSVNPYYVTILLKTGRIFNEEWRGLVFDWREIETLLKNASALMSDLNI